jgi:hypothetical protein
VLIKQAYHNYNTKKEKNQFHYQGKIIVALQLKKRENVKDRINGQIPVSTGRGKVVQTVDGEGAFS